MSHSNMKGMFLTYRPPVKPNQSILGYIYEALHIGGHVRVKDLAMTLVGRTTIQPPWTVPSNLFQLCKELTPVFSSAEEIFSNHTCLPAHMPFVPLMSRYALFSQVFAGVWQRGIAGVVGLTGRAIQHGPKMALCRKCMQEDELQYGIAYWHREHALAGLGYCPHHATPLFVGCGECRFSQKNNRHPLLPQRFCWCGNNNFALSHPPVSAANGRVLARLAGLGFKLLNGALSYATPDVLGAYFHLCAQRAGFSDGSRVKTPDLAEAIRERYSMEVLRRLNAVFESRQNWLETSIGAMHAQSTLGRNLLLFDFFESRIPAFEDIASAHAHMKDVKLMRASQKASGTVASKLEIQADRDVIQEFLKRHPSASRTQVLKALGRTAMRARERDSEWYDSLLAERPRGGNVKGEREQAQYWIDFDVRAEAHVLKRRDDILNSSVSSPVRITKTALLKGTPRGNEVTKELLKKLPRTAKAITASVESAFAFKVRFARAILLQPDRELHDRVSEAKDRTGLTYAEIDRINFQIVARSA